MLSGCSAPHDVIPLGPYAREPKTIERKVMVDLGDGRRGFVKRTEVDLDDYIALINSVPIKDLDKHPRPLAIPTPVYPRSLEKQGIQGTAEIYMIIDERGMVESARVSSATRPEFGEAAINAVLSWRFEPMTRQGKPTKVALAEVFPFRLP